MTELNCKGNDTNELIYKAETDFKKALIVARERIIGRDREIGMDMYTL